MHFTYQVKIKSGYSPELLQKLNESPVEVLYGNYNVVHYMPYRNYGSDCVMRSETKDLSSDKIDIIHVYNGKNAIDKYGTKGENGVFVVKTKSENCSNFLTTLPL